MASSAAAVTLDDLRRMAYAGEIDRVSQALMAEQQAFRAGDVSADRIRELYSVFATTDRRMVKFVAAWLEKQPENALSNTAWAMTRKTAARNLKGEERAWGWHEEAVFAYRDNIKEARERATQAFHAMPDLIPASDLAIRLTTEALDAYAAIEIGYKAMDAAPNWGTVQKLIYMAAPWYESAFVASQEGLIDRICEHFGPLVPTDGPDMTLRCLYLGYAEFELKEREEWLMEHTDIQDPMLDDAQMVLIMRMAERGEATQRQMLRFREYVERPGQTNIKLAGYYDRAIAFQNGWPAMEGAVAINAIEDAREQIKHDPYNHDLIELVRSDIVPGDFKSDGGREYIRISEPPSTEQQLDYVWRKLSSRRYDAALWLEYAMLLDLRPEPEYMTASNAFLENAAYYAGHRPQVLANILYRTMQQYQVVELARVEDLPPEWENYLAELDAERFVLCPFLRAYRQYEAGCNSFLPKHAVDCEITEDISTEYERLAALASSDPKCEFVATAPISKLRYTPVPLPRNSMN